MDEAEIFESHYEFIENLAPLSNNLPALAQFIDEKTYHYTIRKMAVEKIAQIPHQKSEKILKKALNDSHQVVAQSALEALYSLQNIKVASNDTNILLARLAKLQWEIEFKKIDAIHGQIMKNSIITALRI